MPRLETSSPAVAAAPAPATLLQALRTLVPRASPPPRLAVVVAHPDDETIGAGAQLPDWPSAHLLHVTDGSPPSLADAAAVGCATREEYARLRRRELDSALGLAGIFPIQVHSLGYGDQEVAHHLTQLTVHLAGILAALCPDIVLTHPYEGGHPDHDAVAFAMHAAQRFLQEQENCTPILVEFTCYHNRAGSLCSGDFLPGAAAWSATLPLSEPRRALKQRMLACFASQQRVLECFPVETERFRLAPTYDFTQPPHEGSLYYELQPWGMTGKEWRSLAQQALFELGAPVCL